MARIKVLPKRKKKSGMRQLVVRSRLTEQQERRQSAKAEPDSLAKSTRWSKT